MYQQQHPLLSHCMFGVEDILNRKFSVGDNDTHVKLTMTMLTPYVEENDGKSEVILPRVLSLKTGNTFTAQQHKRTVQSGCATTRCDKFLSYVLLYKPQCQHQRPASDKHQYSITSFIRETL